jgi:hypothetical protein
MRLVEAIQLPDGAWVRGRGLREPAPGGPAPEYGLYLGTGLLRRRYGAVLRWDQRWIDWPDFLLPRDRAQAIERIRDLHARAGAGERVEVACGGGRGRTGTVIACLAVLSGLTPGDAVAWTRAAYRSGAVETPWQRRWVERFGAELA